MPFGAPPLPPGPHASLLAGNQQHGYQQTPQQIQQQLLQQQMPPRPIVPPKMPQLRPGSHMPMLPHPHLQRPPPQMPPHGVPSPRPSSMSGSLPSHSSHQMPMPGPMGQANVGGGQMYPQGGAFNRGQGGQMPMMPGFNPYQSGGQSGMLPPPQSSGHPPHGQLPQ
ncbi:Detected protein of unknown function [Hibiscus syriacus]|uniref:Uncharacterized protein n=1 Tax=Hibiscus syriacus TaxID=106335 RepID=A0A6A2WNW1_HIBSY|nr:Detected protein of unknown function [Hibiscus syriacus]